MEDYSNFSKEELVAMLEKASSKATPKAKIEESKYRKVLALLLGSGLKSEPRSSIFKFEGTAVGWIAVEKSPSGDCCRLSKFSIPLQEGILDVSKEESSKKHWGNVYQKINFTASEEEIESSIKSAIEALR